ncbi:MAG: 30S ribosomal protein S16 [Victivallales bacterium]|jgi:small subunit ribosomal protein S16|nr:30S ribosomal protein S16 [Victivallales bacterium]
MAVKIRLRRTGKRNAPCHRIVVADGRSPRDGRFIECIGTYDPRAKAEKIDLERADHWVSQGAQPSETVQAIMNRARAGKPLGHDKVPTPAPEAAAPPVETPAPEAVEAAADADADANEE